MKRNTTFKALAALTLAALLCLGGATAAQAAEPRTGTEEDPAKAAIAKVLQMPEGTTTPAAAFQFNVTAKTVDGVAATATNMPVIAQKEIEFAAANAGTTDADGLKTVVLETTDIFAGVDWPHAGEYTYTVSEAAGSYTGATGEEMTYSGGSYDVTVYVQNKANGSGVFVYAIGATIAVKDTDDQDAVGTKVDPTPGGEPTVEGDYSGMVFTNTFTKMNGGDAAANSVLTIGKTVNGAYADKMKYFSYSLRMYPAATLPSTTVYKVYVLDETGTVVTSANNVDGTALLTDTNQVTYFEVPAGPSYFTVMLKHGQRLSFTDAHVGTKYAITEAATPGYTPQYTVVVNGSATSTTPGPTNGALAIGPTLVGEGANSLEYTNTYQTVTPTGIALNDLPFIVLLVLAAGAFAAFVVVKARKRARSRQ